MCGIVGVVAKGNSGFFKPMEDSFMQMLYADALRGDDSTGVVGIEKDASFHIAKKAISSEWFINQLRLDHSAFTTRMWNQGKAWIGHNRKKTVGEVKDETAHPFVVNNTFALVHNGTLYNKDSLATGCDVDSEALAIHLHAAVTKGGEDLKKVAKEVELALPEVSGAYAIAAYDQNMHRLFLLRNKERPLAIIELENAYYFMSEPLMGAWILARNGYPYDKMKVEACAEHCLYTFDLDTNKMYREQLHPKKWQSPNTNSGSSGQSHPGWIMGGRTQEKATPTSPMTSGSTKATAGKSTKIIELGYIKKFRRSIIGKRIEFWADDYLETNFPKTIDEDHETDVTVMGKSEDIDYAHDIYAQVDLGQLGIRYSEDITKSKWSGTVDDIEITPAGYIRIKLMAGCKPKLQSLQLSDLKNWRDGLRKMRYDALTTIREEQKYGGLTTWQKSQLNSEIAFRDGITGVEQAAKVAREKANGAILKQELKDDMLVYLDDDGNVYYETPIVVH